MKGNARFTQPNFYQYKHDLSPFGQKIFNVLTNNKNKDYKQTTDEKQRCSNSKYNSALDRRNGRKRKLLTFDDARSPRPPLFSQSEPSQDYFKDCTGNTYNSDDRDFIIINDHDVGDFSTSDELLQINSKDRSSAFDADRYQHNLVPSNPVEDKPNVTSAGLLQLSSLHNDAKQDALNDTTSGLPLSKVTKDDARISDVLFQSNPVQIDAVEDRYNVFCADSLQFNRSQNNFKENRANVVPALLKQFDSVQNNFQEDKSTFTAAESLQINSARNIVYDNSPDPNATLLSEDRASITSIKPYASTGLPKNAPENSPSICNLELLRPLELFCPESNKSSDIFKVTTPTHSNHSNEESDVPWSDMFDTDLVPNDIIAPAVKEKFITKQNAATDEKQFKICFSNNSNTNLNINSIKKNDRHGTEKKAKCVKRKKQNSEDKTPKEIKEICTKSTVRKAKYTKTVKKSTVRKEKYTTIVKNWLDGIHPNNPVETENHQESEIQDFNKLVEPETRKEDHKLENKKNLSNKQKTSAKKVVQARLANKGGIMKFDKPEVEQDSGKNSSSDAAMGMESVGKVTNKVTAKRGKRRFVAPLKSQEPVVKEIEFTVVSIDDSNWEEHFAKMQSSNTNELFAVLMYSNGFNQLNKQFTEDDCIPEGIMLLIDEEFYYFQKTHDTFSGNITKFLENQTVVCYDGKYILIFLKHFDLEVNFVVEDVKIGGSLLEPDSPPESFGALQQLVSAGAEAACALQRAARGLALLRDTARALRLRLRQRALWSLFEDIEMKVLPIIADMEFHGIAVDVAQLQAMERSLRRRLRALRRRCARAAGRDFRPTAPAQVAALLYDELQLHARCDLAVRETPGKGVKSTSEDMLRTLVPLHPLPGLILEYRRLHKAHATFLVGIAQHVKDGVLKPTWEQSAAATGRIACSNPNVQAIPKEPIVLSADDDNPAEEQLSLRSLLVARAGRVLLSADFRHVECRVFAAAAGDTALRAALAAHRDLFRGLAQDWLNKPAGEVSAAERERTKRLVYARLYGAGQRKLMDILRLSRQQARAVSASFDRTFPSLKTFGESVARQCAAGSAPRTPSGRARALPALASADPAERAHAQRQAVNFLIQGTAADVCKVAMWRAQAQLAAAGLRARLLLQLHDELLWELPEGDVRAAHAVIRAAMEGSGACAALPALPVALRAGRRWGQLRDLTDCTDDFTLI